MGEIMGDDDVALALPLPVAGVGLVGADDGGIVVVGGGEAGIPDGVLELGLEDSGAD